MTKSILLLALIAALGFGLSGCSTDYSSGEPMTQRTKSGSPGRTATQ